MWKDNNDTSAGMIGVRAKDSHWQNILQKSIDHSLTTPLETRDHMDQILDQQEFEATIVPTV